MPRYGQAASKRVESAMGRGGRVTKPVEFDVLQQVLAAADKCLPHRDGATR